MTAKEQAIAYHNMGYNCAQSVACAYAEKAGADRETVFKMMEGFGLGMGGTQATCGAISGAVAVAGLLKSSAKLDAPDSKADTYRKANAIVLKFSEKNKAIVCRQLKGLDTGKVLRSCAGCIEDACDLLEETFPQLK